MSCVRVCAPLPCMCVRVYVCAPWCMPLALPYWAFICLALPTKKAYIECPAECVGPLFECVDALAGCVDAPAKHVLMPLLSVLMPFLSMLMPSLSMC